ncbi:hypothetical protein FGRMN_1655 [Fusarium graminum]|nr:hypothetical protein FGRMN_1655 [Fusarium graminum]
MADEDYGPVADESQAPGPDVDPTATKEWVSLEDERGLNTVQIALLRRTEFSAGQNRAMMQSNELILSAIANTEADETAEIDDPVVTVAYSALTDIKGEKHQLLVNLHRPLIETNNKKCHVKHTIIATNAAIEFIDHIKTTLTASDGDGNKHSDTALRKSILEDLDHLNTDLYTNLYIDLNQGLKKSKAKGKGKAIAKPKPKASVSTRSASPPMEHSSPMPARTRSRTKHHIVVSSDEGSDDQGEGAATPTHGPDPGPEKAPLASARQISNTSQDNSNSQASLTSVELRRSHQSFRFEYNGHDDDDDLAQ